MSKSARAVQIAALASRRGRAYPYRQNAPQQGGQTMSANPTTALADFLSAKAQAVRTIETEAQALLAGAPDQEGYGLKMRAKAELLAALADDAGPLLAALPEHLCDVAAVKLEGFSANAANALRIGSVFYMSALLYPDDHKPGEPNNLELFAAEVRAWA
jgi:hypothetical protein